jgi:probable HAF family extracellular repeat protein
MMTTARATLLVTLLCLASTAQAETISGITLTDLGAGVVPNAINNVGQVVGQDGSGQAFLWQSGTFTPLGTLGGTQSAANDINDSGVVVGWANLANGKQHAFKWDGAITDLDAGINYATVAEAVNNSGDVAGWATTSGQYRSRYWPNGGSGQNLFGTANSKALGIDNSGDIVGVRINATSGSPDLGYYWQYGNGSSWKYGYGGYYPLAGIANNGMTAGQDGLEAASLAIGDSVPSPIGRLNPTDLASSACGLNDASTYIVGYSDTQGLLFDTTTHTLYNLNNLLPTGTSFTQLTSANDINNSGEFVGVGLVGGVEHGFVGQIVVPEPSTLCGLVWLAVMGGLLRFVRRWKTMVLLSAVILSLTSVAKAETIGTNLWNLRENNQYFFDNNDSWVRPWRTTYDDGYGMFVGPAPDDGDFSWNTSSTTGNPLDGSLTLIRGVDHQFDAWTYLYVPTPTIISLTGQGDCVPCWFLNYAFDSPQQFPLGDDSATINLVAGWNRLDITGYNQSDGFLFTSGSLASQVAVMNTSPVPEPSSLVLFGIGAASLFSLRRRRIALASQAPVNSREITR